jgi:hypothetical protein
MNGAVFWITTITQICINLHLVSLLALSNRKEYLNIIIFRKLTYSNGVGMRYQYSNNKILEKTDFDKIESDRHKFIYYPEFEDC